MNVTVLDSVDSTNEWLKQHGQKHGEIVISREQTCGKGSKGRSFFSPSGTGLYMSILLKDNLVQEQLKLLTPAAASAAAEAIEIICGVKTQIKWVNDIYTSGKKVCGILTESVLDENGCLSGVIVGIGVNLFEPVGGFGELSESAGAVLKRGGGHLFNALAAEIVNRFRMYSESLEERAFLSAYTEKSNIIGKKITVFQPSRRFSAVAKEIDRNGNLIVEDENKNIITLSSGEVSLRF